MSRKYLNERWCVRCGREGPTPYLRDNWELFGVASSQEPSKAVLDIGCGNGRNTKFMQAQGFTNTAALDMVGDYGHKVVLGQETLPLLDNSVDIILANYIFMFLDIQEREQLVSELQRVARPGCHIMVELYPAKDSEASTKETMIALRDELLVALNSGQQWAVVRKTQERFIGRLAV